VSGQLGEADVGLSALHSVRGKIRPSNPVLQKHLYPEPRIALGQWLADHRLATAAMDLSDGLSTDLARLCASSGAGATIEMSKLADAAAQHAPVPKRAGGRRSHSGNATAVSNRTLSLALNGGDDYELLFTVARSKARKIPSTHRGLKLTAIGEITRGHRIELQKPDGSASPLKPGGWDPFA